MKTATGSLLTGFLLLVASCGSEPKPGSTSQAISENASHACDGLQNAYANCPNPRSCDHALAQLVKHGCLPAVTCPCTFAPAPVGVVHISKCPVATGGSLALCNDGANICAYGFGPNDPQEDPAVCDACRAQYGVTCSPPQ